MNDFQYSKAEILLKVEDLSVTYSSPILKGVNWEIRDIKRPGLTQGQKVALLAPSGLGKTQLFKRLSGLQPPTTGTIKIGVDQKPVRPGMVGMVPQDYRVFSHRTVEGNLMVAASMREPDKDKARAKVVELMERFNLTGRAKAWTQELSGGQKQRVSIAEQLLSSADFLLMDEPFSGLDIMAKKVVMDVIDGVASASELSTIIFSTHDIESAVMIADTIVILGRDRDPNGHPIPGAKIQCEIDLIDRNLAWHPDIEHQPEFFNTVNEIKGIFPRL